MEKDYKDTLLLPKTSFPMRANLMAKEPLFYKKLDEKSFQTKDGKVNAYHYMQSLRQKGVDDANTFTLHDGPPYANGHLHIGHALNIILKDFLVKVNYFNGKYPYFLAGWDCHGLPIEQQVENALKKKGINIKDVPKEEVRDLCAAHANKFIDIQRKEFKSLGVIGEFDHPYITMDFPFEANIYRALTRIAKLGILEERSKPIYWSYAAKSALAEAEIEYKDKTSISVFVHFDLDEASCEKLEINSTAFEKGAKPGFVIWTTTPWTLPSNAAIALKADAIYALCSDGHIVAKELLPSLVEEGIVGGKVLREFTGSELEGLSAINPLNDRESRIILGHHVELASGTGCVHTAPAHGEDDYIIAKSYNLPIPMPISDSGCYDETIRELGLFRAEVIDEMLGLHIYKAEERILEILGKNLLAHKEIVHSYPHCWRTGKPVIFRATKQWFILLDKAFECKHKDGHIVNDTLRNIALRALDDVKFTPPSGERRIRAMVEQRDEWCISRQRAWGVPLAFFLDENNEAIFDDEIFDHLYKLFYEKGCSIWWSYENEDLLPPSYKSRAKELKKSMHILDVWFDSGSTWLSALDASINETPNMQIYDGGHYRSDVYLEGSDQHRGWFQSSLLISCALYGVAPYKQLLTHGFTFDKDGYKMSKSRGNVISPEEIIKKYGSEIARLWVANSNYTSDQSISNDILAQISEMYRKIRNTIRFLLANTDGLEKIDLSSANSIDLYILTRAHEVFYECGALRDSYDFTKLFSVLNAFITNELSGLYLDLIKDALYCEDEKSSKLIAIRSTLCLIANNLLFILAPFLTYTVDEALSCANSPMSESGDIFTLAPLPIKDYGVDMTYYLGLRDAFLTALDAMKKEGSVKSSLELGICVPKDAKAGLSTVLSLDELASFLIVSEASEGTNEIDGENISAKITFDFDGSEQIAYIYKATKHKCPRCWRYLAKSEDALCPRCASVLASRGL